MQMVTHKHAPTPARLNEKGLRIKPSDKELVMVGYPIRGSGQLSGILFDQSVLIAQVCPWNTLLLQFELLLFLFSDPDLTTCI